MTDEISASIIQHFSGIQDPRVNRQKKHQLQDIFFITPCAVICGADNWVAIEEFGDKLNVGGPRSKNCKYY